MTATDADIGRNAELSVFISQEEEEEEGMFFISNTTGSIWCRRPLDREARAVHRFGVIAVDGGDPPRSCSTTVTLFVADENDNPPRVVSPGNASYTLLPPSTPVHSEVARVVAVDADEGQNAELRFSLAGGNPFGLFSVDPRGGAVVLAGALGAEHGGLHRLVLRVSDGGSPPLHTSALLHLFVNHTLGNESWVRQAVARSLALPLSHDVAGHGPPSWPRPQGLSMAIGALAGGVAVLLLIMLVVMVTHCAPGSRKGYRVGRREEGEEGAAVAEGDRKTAAGRYSAVTEGSPDLARHYALTPPPPRPQPPPTLPPPPHTPTPATCQHLRLHVNPVPPRAQLPVQQHLQQIGKNPDHVHVSVCVCVCVCVYECV